MSAPLLQIRDLHAYYGAVAALHGVDLTVDSGEVVVVLGANGAGKTTTLRAICQLVKVRGEVLVDGQSVVGTATSSLVRRGVAMVPQGRGTLTELTVEENLRAGAYVRRDKRVRDDIAAWFDTFPRLAERRHTMAGSLSGGEQQMLAIARALMSRPRLLLLDEPSLGLAPVIVKDLFEVLAQVNRDSEVAIVLVEQNASLALDLAQRGYVLEAGRIVVAASAADLRANADVRRAYLGY